MATGGAFAAGPGGVETCPSGSVCLYYNSPGNGWGSFENWTLPVDTDLSGKLFAHWANGSGYGQVVADNAASIVNNTGQYVQVTTDTGGHVNFVPGYAGSLNEAANHDTHLWG
ncbi:peptidase inhibitor family I36 protein [Streptacidiphilus neutrinimicus]|uniref:peptidase inhibitor family I36 protein n=1 Tax=Streptacidiphilus neutrinimicus TaxID=105420 RepID=UPI002286EE10|nr:peptidase inhibitor family I36 protein [Streptacidiphilus neutrinimicus]